MKKIRLYKLVQAILIAVLGLSCAIGVFVFYHTPMAELFLQLSFWLLIVLSFLFILFDLKALASIDSKNHTMRRAAFVDSLTGVLNHTGMDYMLREKEKEEVLPSLGCLAFRLENLYETNDTQGHAAGDWLVLRFSSLLSGAVGPSALICRNNPTLFLAIVENCTPQLAQSILAKLKKSIEENNLAPGNPVISYTDACALNSQEHCASSSDLISTAYRLLSSS